VRVLRTLLLLLLAFVVQTLLSQLAPAQSRVLDPFLLVVVYCGLVGGETHGMLAGAAAGWIQDVHFGGSVLGMTALSKLVVGFLVGLAGARFLLAAPAARGLVVLVAALVDALLFSQMSTLFDVPTLPSSAFAIAGRAALNAAIGMLLFRLLDRHWPGDRA
jgi:rod shape-determining protein MreD